VVVASPKFHLNGNISIVTSNVCLQPVQFQTVLLDYPTVFSQVHGVLMLMPNSDANCFLVFRIFRR